MVCDERGACHDLVGSHQTVKSHGDLRASLNVAMLDAFLACSAISLNAAGPPFLPGVLQTMQSKPSRGKEGGFVAIVKGAVRWTGSVWSGATHALHGREEASRRTLGLTP